METLKGSTSSSPSKPGRVKVGVRCRPAFQDEIEFAKGEFVSIVDTRAEALHDPSMGQLSLALMNGKQREFLYDYVFGVDATQDHVYNTIARPVVTDVLKGYNGTIFAYGQTGTGKTYTMGILEFINNEHAGIIPRAVAQIFEFADRQRRHHPGNDITISLSFLQLYRETIQDLLAPANGTATTVDDNLQIREDPQRGFYVEGLQEFAVTRYEEAEALINLGLENRAIAPTLMNATSSRSHTVLTINIEQRVATDVQIQQQQQGGNGGGGSLSRASSSGNLAGGGGRKGSGAQYTRTLRSKLLMVDLAGSERVARTSSKGARLSEAKSINTSLSALGNVISALATEPAGSYVQYRNSKLTRLLQDSLGGTARTALIATIGPAAVNYGETLSTLTFASRCMSVKSTPIQHAEVDYAEMCAALQARVNEMEGATTQRLLEQQEGYEATVRELRTQLEAERSSLAQQQQTIAAQGRDVAKAQFNSELRILLDQVEKVRRGDRSPASSGDRNARGAPPLALDSWLGKPIGYSPSASHPAPAGSDTQLSCVAVEAQQAQLLGYCFHIIAELSAELSDTLQRNSAREELAKLNLSDEFSALEKVDAQRHREKASMDAEDPRNKGPNGANPNAEAKIGSHLAPMSLLDAKRRVEGQFQSNNAPIARPAGSAAEAQAQWLAQTVSAPVVVEARPAIYNYSSIEEVCRALTSMHAGIRENMTSMKALMARKDAHFQSVKEELTQQLVEKRKREEEVINWSYILKYLLSSASKLRKELKEGGGGGSGTVSAPPAVPHTGAEAPNGERGESAGRLGSGFTRQALERAQLQSAAHTQDTATSELDESAYGQAARSHDLPRSTRGEVGSHSMVLSTGATAASGRTVGSGTGPVATHMAPTGPRSSSNGGRDNGSVGGGAMSRPPLGVVGPAAKQGGFTSLHAAAPSPDSPFAPTTSSGHSGPFDDGPISPPYSSLDEAEFMSQASTIQTRPSLQGDMRGRPLPGGMPATGVRHGRDRGEAVAQSYPAASRPYGSGAVQTPYDRDYPSGPLPGTAPSVPFSAQSSRRELRMEYDSPKPGHHYQPPPSSQRPQPQPGEFNESPAVAPPPRSRPPSAQSAQSRSSAHSRFAQGVVQELGVDRSQASAAMAVVDKVAQMTDAQLAQLDPATRHQILQIRRELGLSAPVAQQSSGARPRAHSNSRPVGGPVGASTHTSRSTTPTGRTSSQRQQQQQQDGIRNLHYYDSVAPQEQPRRASSAPRQRSVSSGSASLLSQQQQQQKWARAPSAGMPTFWAPRTHGADLYPSQARHGHYGHYGHYGGGAAEGEGYDDDDDDFSQLDM